MTPFHKKSSTQPDDIIARPLPPSTAENGCGCLVESTSSNGNVDLSGYVRKEGPTQIISSVLNYTVSPIIPDAVNANQPASLGQVQALIPPIGNYIQNQSDNTQDADFRIGGTGIADTFFAGDPESSTYAYISQTGINWAIDDGGAYIHLDTSAFNISSSKDIILNGATLQAFNAPTVPNSLIRLVDLPTYVIQNQSSISQPSTNFWISGSGKLDGNITASGIFADSAEFNGQVNMVFGNRLHFFSPSDIAAGDITTSNSNLLINSEGGFGLGFNASTGMSFSTNTGNIVFNNSSSFLDGLSSSNAPINPNDVVRLSDISGLGGGTVTSVTSSNSDIGITSNTTTPVLTLNRGVTGLTNYYDKATSDGRFLGLHATADNSMLLNGTAFQNSVSTNPIQQLWGNDSILGAGRVYVASQVITFLGLGSNAFTSTTYMPTSGGTFTGDVQQATTPVNGTSLINKSYVDNLLTGITWKQEVRVGTTANIILSGTQTIDGVALVANDRVLVKNQTTATANGIYLVQSGTWTRSADADSGSEIGSATVLIRNGTVNKNTQWTCTNSIDPVIGTDNITFGQISGAGTYTNGTGILLTANVFSLDLTYTDARYQSVLLGTGFVKSTGGTISYDTNVYVPQTTTVAGFALSGNITLANLIATDTSLTFSGTYNGSTARTVGLNLGNANIFTADQTASNFITSGGFGVGSSPSGYAFYAIKSNPGGSINDYTNTSNTGYTASNYRDNTGTLQLSMGYANTSAVSMLAGTVFFNSNASAPILFAINGAERLRVASSLITGAVNIAAPAFVTNGGTSTQYVKGDGTLGTYTTATTAANPTGLVATVAVNGTATTYMRSDAAPAISQGIVPTWTGVHTFSARPVFNGGIAVTSTFQTSGTLYVGSGTVASNSNTSSGNFAGAASVDSRISSNSSSNSTLTVGASYATMLIGSGPITTGATGTNPWAVSFAINSLGAVIVGGSGPTNTATLYVGAPVSSGTNNYSAYFASPKIGLAGSTSGVITMGVQAAAGTYNFNMPITAGTAGQVLTSQAGGSTAMTWTTLFTQTIADGRYIDLTSNQSAAGNKTWTGALQSFNSTIAINNNNIGFYSAGGANSTISFIETTSGFFTGLSRATTLTQNSSIFLQDGSGTLAFTSQVSFHSNSTTTGTATTRVTVSIGRTMPNANYNVCITPKDLLTAVNYWIDPATITTTTFDVVFITALTGSINFDWNLTP